MKRYYLLLLLLILIPLKVNACGSSSLDCSFNNGTQLTCNLYISTSDRISGLQGNVSVTGGTFSSLSTGSKWKFQSKNGGFFVALLANDEESLNGITGSGINVVNFTANASNASEITATVSQLEASDNNGNVCSINSVSKTVRKPETTTTTKSSIPVNEEQTTVPATTRMRYITTTSEPAIIFDIVTTKAMGTTTTYPALKDNTLDDLNIEGHSINFLRELYTYNIVIPESEKSINVNYTLTNPSYNVIVAGVNDLKLGLNKATITITNLVGDTKVYTINIYRGNTVLNSDSSLKNITVDKYSLNFKSDVYDYDLVIRNDSKLKLTVVPNKATTTYQIMGENVLKDNSVIVIKTIAQDNSSSEYRINVHFAIKTISPYLVYTPLTLIICGAIGFGYTKIKTKKKKSLAIENLVN